jgi:ABC-type lipoprotein export system ATPase subunit
MISSDYLGMKWLKCDLQVQTPEDSRHWLDDDLKLLEPRRPKNNGSSNEDDIQEKARRYLRRCHEVELDLIAVTDHNFSSKSDPRDWFGVHLIEQNKTIAKEFNRNPLFIFPGFEVDIGYHVLCLFEPAKKQIHFEKCNTILTSFGMSETARFNSGLPKQLRFNGQSISLKKLIEVVQNENGGIVIAAHADQADGIYQNSSNRDDYSNEQLYALELTKNPPSEKYQNILDGKNNDWKRSGRQPAWIMSSDAKSIRKENGQPKPNSIGYRYSWIKMSKPSIESLRQAFLDHESRIILPTDVSSDKHPNVKNQPGVIKSIEISGAPFLDDQTIHFSPNLNCIIGGRGSGKSSLLEYLRIMFSRDKDDTIDGSTKIKIERIKKTLSEQNVVLKCKWIKGGVEDSIEWKAGSPQVNRADMADPQTFFNGLSLSFYSQQQLNHLTDLRGTNEDKTVSGGLYKLIDGFSESEFKKLSDREHKIKLQLNDSFNASQKLKSLKQDRQKIQQELAELTRQAKARTDIQDELSKHQQLKEEERFLKQLSDDTKGNLKEIRSIIDTAKEKEYSFDKDVSQNKQFIESYTNDFESAREELFDGINGAISSFVKKIKSLQESDSRWQDLQERFKHADTHFKTECERIGIEPDDILQLQKAEDLSQEKQNEIEALNKEITPVTESAEKLKPLLKELQAIWKLQFEERRKAAEKANTAARMKGYDRSFVEVTVKYQQDIVDFMKLWNGVSPEDKRTRLGKNWEEIGKSFYEEYSKTEGLTPHDFLDFELIFQETENETLTRHSSEIQEFFEEKPELKQKLEITRVKDKLDMILFRSDGSEAGRISNGSLSDGQRNTAALALLLSQDGGPIIIDQPEDELDSNFVFKELIPMIRNVKTKRQLIIATHNANLPVNGDAELVYAFEAKDGKGKPLAVGGLDQPEVTKAVLDIMEGTEEAFRKRREKYHF